MNTLCGLHRSLHRAKASGAGSINSNYGAEENRAVRMGRVSRKGPGERHKGLMTRFAVKWKLHNTFVQLAEDWQTSLQEAAEIQTEEVVQARNWVPPTPATPGQPESQASQRQWWPSSHSNLHSRFWGSRAAQASSHVPQGRSVDSGKQSS